MKEKISCKITNKNPQWISYFEAKHINIQEEFEHFQIETGITPIFSEENYNKINDIELGYVIINNFKSSEELILKK